MESNHHPLLSGTAFEAACRPLALFSKKMATVKGIEPLTCGFGDRHSAN